MIDSTPAETILRTDIRKIEGVTKFPWSSVNQRAVLLGDSANATAPNLAQGAGLAIESAWDLFSSHDTLTADGIQKYVQKRQKRALTVQSMADMVARVGQLHAPASTVRDFFMRTGTSLTPGLEQKIF